MSRRRRRLEVVASRTTRVRDERGERIVAIFGAAPRDYARSSSDLPAWGADEPDVGEELQLGPEILDLPDSPG